MILTDANLLRWLDNINEFLGTVDEEFTDTFIPLAAERKRELADRPPDEWNELAIYQYILEDRRK